MGITERRERERFEIRRKILDAARELFAREGYDKVTMRRIADVIEYSPTTIYHHFEDKEDLVDSLCEEDFGRLLAALQAQPVPEDPVESLRQLARAYASFGLENPNHYRFMFMTPTTQKAGRPVSSSGQMAFGVLLSVIETGIAAGRFRAGDPRSMAHLCWSMLHGVVALLVTYQPTHFPGGQPSPDLLDQVIEGGVRALLPEAGREKDKRP